MEECLKLVKEYKEPYMKITPNGFEFSCSQISIIKQNTLPKQVFFNDKKKTTVLKWEDDSITKVKCHDDEFDERTGFLIAYFQKTCGLTKNKANKYLESLVPKEDKPIEILDTEEEMVFSVYKFLEEHPVYKIFKSDWTLQCDGKTREECSKLRYASDKKWEVPRSQFKPYVEENNYIPSREV